MKHSYFRQGQHGNRHSQQMPAFSATKINRPPQGNQWLQNALRANLILPQLKVNTPGDRFEQEAESTAAKVMRMHDNEGQAAIQRSPCTDCEDKIQRQPEEEEEEMMLNTNSSTKQADTPHRSPSTVALSTSGQGKKMPAETRSFFEPRFGQDFSHVNIHADTESAQMAQSINARAFTYGNHIYFNRNEYQPQANSGKHLLAHELTHVIQQNRGATDDQPQLQRWSYGSGAVPHGDYVEVPANERGRVDSAMNIVGRIADHPENFPRCHNFFRDNCPGGTDDTLKQVYDRAIMWKDTDATILGSRVAPDNIAYTDLSYGVGRWAIAASMIHELIHVCGQANHDIGDDAKAQCGALPNI